MIHNLVNRTLSSEIGIYILVTSSNHYTTFNRWIPLEISVIDKVLPLFFDAVRLVPSRYTVQVLCSKEVLRCLLVADNLLLEY
jgi:hypothetical protein